MRPACSLVTKWPVIANSFFTPGLYQQERSTHIGKDEPVVRNTVHQLASSTCSRPSSVSDNTANTSLLTWTRLRKRSIALNPIPNEESDSENYLKECKDDIDYSPKKSNRGRDYKKGKSFFVNEESCVLADRRMTTLRQQSDQLLSVIGADNIAAFCSIYRHREKCV